MTPPSLLLPFLNGESFILRGPMRPGLSETTYCRNFLQLHHFFRGSFILRGRFGPVCQRLPIVETSSNWTFSTLTTFNSTAPPSSTGTQTHDSLSPHFSYKVSTSTGTQTHDSLLSRLVPLPMTLRPPLKT